MLAAIAPVAKRRGGAEELLTLPRRLLRQALVNEVSRDGLQYVGQRIHLAHEAPELAIDLIHGGRPASRLLSQSALAVQTSPAAAWRLRVQRSCIKTAWTEPPGRPQLSAVCTVPVDDAPYDKSRPGPGPAQPFPGSVDGRPSSSTFTERSAFVRSLVT